MYAEERKKLQDTFNIASNVGSAAEGIARNNAKILMGGLAISIALAFFVNPLLAFVGLTGTAAYKTIEKRKDLLNLSREFKETVKDLRLKGDTSFIYIKDIAKELEDVEPLGAKDLDLENLWKQDKLYTGLMVASSIMIPAFMPLAIASLMGHADDRKLVMLRAAAGTARENMLKAYPGQFEDPRKSAPAPL